MASSSDRLSVRPRRLEPLAAADRRDDEVERGVHRVAALFDQIVRRLLGRSDLNEPGLILLTVFSEMGTEAALAVMNLHHGVPPFRVTPEHTATARPDTLKLGLNSF
jgi:hypothetical protein